MARSRLRLPAIPLVLVSAVYAAFHLSLRVSTSLFSPLVQIGHRGSGSQGPHFTARRFSQQRGEAADEIVTVVGASGNVGKLVVLRLIDEGYIVHAVVRSQMAKARLLDFLGPERGPKVRAFQADVVLDSEGLDEAFRGASAGIVCTGTTAFPTKAWAGGSVGPDQVSDKVWGALWESGFDVRRAVDSLTAAGLNTPDAVDATGVEAIVASLRRNFAGAGDAPSTFKQLVLMSSLGVRRRDGFPFRVLNAAGVLDAKARGEAAVCAAAEEQGFAWTIARPGQLFGGPYDNNFYLGTLFQLDKDVSTRGVDVQQGDEAAGDTLRSSLAEVLVQCLQNVATRNSEFTILNVAGEAPSAANIQDLLTSACVPAGLK